MRPGKVVVVLEPLTTATFLSDEEREAIRTCVGVMQHLRHVESITEHDRIRAANAMLRVLGEVR